MKKNYKPKRFCRLLVTCRVLFCSILLLGITAALTSSPVYGQQNSKRFSLKLTQVSVLDALREINQLSDNSVVFKKEEVEKETVKVTVDLNNVTTLQAVQACIKNTNLECRELNDKVVVGPKKAPTSVTITGTVKDKEGQPLPGATVVVAGDSLHLGTSTTIDGAYTLTVPSAVKSLIYSFIGYKSQQVVIGNRTVINVVLEEDVKEVEEVVVTGMFTRKANTYAGSAVTLTSKDIVRTGSSNLFQSLKNLDPALFIMDNLDMGSNPNSLPQMQMRGVSSFPVEETGIQLKGNYQNNPNQPLFMLDGFETTVERVMDMDMNRVESVTLLKDAAAKAIYGSKAANGVVVITTKRVTGTQQLVTYTGSVDIEMPDLTSYNLCNAAEKLEAERIDGMYDYKNMDEEIRYSQLYEERKQLIAAGLDTYWLSKPLRTGVGHKHNLSVQLGDQNLQALFSLTYNQVMGVMKGSDRRNIIGEIDLSYRKDNLLFRNNASITNNKSNDSPYGAFSKYAQMNPYWRAKDPETGEVARWAYTGQGASVANPMYDAEIGTLYQQSYVEFINNFEIEWRPIEALILRGGVTLGLKRNDGDEFLPATHSSFASINKYSSTEEQLRKGSYRIDEGKSSTVSANINATYSGTFADRHNIFLNFRTEIGENKSQAYVFQAEGFPNNQIADITFARQYAKDSRPYGSSSWNRNLSFVLAGGYNFDNRYLLDFSAREDASSLYGDDNRWALGWSLALGWNLHNEKFFKNDIIQQFKLRASIGVTGNQNFYNNEAVATYEYYTTDNYLGMTGAQVARMANPKLKGEQKKDYNVGFDAIIYKANIRFDYYWADTKNMLTDVSISTSTGFSTVKDNLGLVRNQGVEVYLTYNVFQNNKGFLNVFGSLTTTTNKIIRLSESMRTYNALRDKMAADKGNNKPVTKYVDGESMNTIWAVRSLGIDPQTGNEVYVKRNGELTYTYDENDQVPAGNSLEKYRGTFGFTAEYKGFGLSTTFRYYTGYQKYNSTLVDRVENVDMNYNVDKRALYGRWKEPGQVAQFKRLGTFQYDGDAQSYQEKTRPTTRFVQDESLLTWGALNLYYEFQPDVLKPLRMSRLKISFNMNDIATFSSVKVERGYSYPFARTMSFSLIGSF